VGLTRDFRLASRRSVIDILRRRRPLGRDGITLRQYKHSFFEVATAATVSVYDRAGKRVTTIYLAWLPELGQATMDRMLTELLCELFNRWQGPLPRLAYVADSGSNENGYYERVLRRMLHPRTGQQLSWQRVVDYYHVSERIWAMATALFEAGTREAYAWAHRMLKALKKPSGASRVLHSCVQSDHLACDFAGGPEEASCEKVEDMKGRCQRRRGGLSLQEGDRPPCEATREGLVRPNRLPGRSRAAHRRSSRAFAGH
jgi:hypothetical protein